MKTTIKLIAPLAALLLAVPALAGGGRIAPNSQVGQVGQVPVSQAPQVQRRRAQSNRFDLSLTTKRGTPDRYLYTKSLTKVQQKAFRGLAKTQGWNLRTDASFVLNKKARVGGQYGSVMVRQSGNKNISLIFVSKTGKASIIHNGQDGQAYKGPKKYRLATEQGMNALAKTLLRKELGAKKGQLAAQNVFSIRAVRIGNGKSFLAGLIQDAGEAGAGARLRATAETGIVNLETGARYKVDNGNLYKGAQAKKVTK